MFPLSNLIATGQIGQGDVIKVDLNGDGRQVDVLQGARDSQLWDGSHQCCRASRIGRPARLAPEWLFSKAKLREWTGFGRRNLLKLKPASGLEPLAC